MTLWLVQLQPLTERYTEQWARWLPAGFKKAGFDVQVIDGNPLTTTIEKGAFLDINGAHYYTFTQLQKITKLFYEDKIKGDDIFFFADIEFPGHIEAVRYMAELQNIPVKIYGFLHACSITKEDVVEKLAPWLKYYELAWIKVCDGVFVGSQFFKDRLIEERIKPFAPKNEQMELSEKIIVTGNPWNASEVLGMVNPLPKKENIVIFPHRWDFDKRPNIFLNLTYYYKKRFPDWKFIVTTSRPHFRSTSPWLEELALKAVEDGVIEIKDGLTKTEYYEWMAKAKIMVSTTVFESWGYITTEAITFGTYPLVPNNFSYQTIMSKENLYSDYDELFDKLGKLMKEDNCTPYRNDWYMKYAESALDSMAIHMGGGKEW